MQQKKKKDESHRCGRQLHTTSNHQHKQDSPRSKAANKASPKLGMSQSAIKAPPKPGIGQILPKPRVQPSWLIDQGTNQLPPDL